MQCPTCPASSLVISERSGVEIDYCPKCRGVWLDRGELDKLVDRAAGEFQPEYAGSTHPRPRPASPGWARFSTSRAILPPRPRNPP
jgi:Zn-finger nucleic acid-binding protein